MEFNSNDPNGSLIDFDVVLTSALCSFLACMQNELLYAEVDMQTWNILGANQLFCANHVNNYDDFL
jgi:hypothetical protein